MKKKMRQQLNKLWLLGCLIVGLSSFAQENKQNLSEITLDTKKEGVKKSVNPKKIIEAHNLTYKGNESLSENSFVAAEKSYRTAIGINPEDATPAYNLGSALYQKEAFEEALTPLKKAVIAGKNKREKHTALHNLGNAFMKNKSYEKAVETYKEALRNNPTDNETRYNLALAKEMLKKEQQEQDKDSDKKDQKDQDKKDQEDQENKDKEDQEGDQKKDPNGDPDKGDGEKEDDNSEPKDPSEEEKEEQKKGDGEDKKETPQKPKKDQGKPKERKSQLSPQQIKNLLDAMQNAEKKSQEKLEGKKIKGAPVKTKKDW
jgi:tetratricopeptide (TPR) repeat protein